MVIIDNDEEAVEKIPEDIPYIKNDAKRNDVLNHAGIKRAKGIVITTSDDAANVFITLTAKGLNKDIETIVRAEEFETEDKMRRAGADHVVNTNDIGGRRMALSMIKPASIHYIDSIMHAESGHHKVEEITIGQNSKLANKKATELRTQDDYGISVLRIERKGEFIGLADKDAIIQTDDKLILFGDAENIKFFTESSFE